MHASHFPLHAAIWLSLLLLMAWPLRSRAQTVDLAPFGLGPITLFSLEVDGDPKTMEFGAINGLGLWVVNPGNYCKSLVTAPFTFEEMTRPGTFFIATLQRIGGVDYLFYTDIDPSDGRLPLTAQRITSECYPPVRQGSAESR
jgi:hypothetical protein